MKRTLLALSILLVFGCNQNEKKETLADEKIMTEPDGGKGDGAVSPAVVFAQNIENAHSKETWKTNKAVAFDIDLTFGGNPRFSGKITSLTNSTKIRIDKKDGVKLIYDGEEVFLCPKIAEEEGARFDMFTWQYFFALPFKLTDPGTNWELLKPQHIAGDSFNRAKLSFENQIGDSPKDWYIIYQEPETGFLHAAAYIVTFGTEKGKAEENPHAIVYKDYVVIDGVPFATTWTFHNWNEKDGIGEQIGQAKISNINFFNPEDELFSKPEDSKIIPPLSSNPQ
ncbi:hypothetical protein ACKGJN_06470 [Gillisia sp. Q332]|uniref:hypothetical protein n=1 Tax=Gillisia xinjiangensis TaxID=3384765 RepID=UPI00391A2E8D